MSFGPIAREAATPAPVEQCTRTLGANELAGGAETGKPRLEFGTSPYTIPQHVGAVGGEHPCVLHRSPEFGRPPGRFRRAGSSAAVRTDGTGCDRGACPDRHAPVWGLPAGRPPGRHDHRAVVAAALGSAARQPRRTSRRWPSSSGLEEARERADRAFKSRPRAFRYVIEIRVDHRELDGGRCRCSKRFDQCTIGQLLAGYPGLLGWERDQVERAKQGLDRRLPGNHPSLIDPRWAEAPRNEYVERDVVSTGPPYFARVLVDELRDRGVEVRERQGRESGTTWTVPVAGAAGGHRRRPGSRGRAPLRRPGPGPGPGRLTGRDRQGADRTSPREPLATAPGTPGAA